MSDNPGEGSKGTGAAVKAVAAAGGAGCLASPVIALGAVVVIIVIGGFGVLLAPVIAIILFFTGGGGGGGDQPDTDPATIVSTTQGDGKGDLAIDAVPDEDLVTPIQDAGALCPDIGPAVIAAQIERESGFDAAKTGPNGEQGISQLDPAVFARFGKDDDDSGEASALDPEDSILAQGRFLCSLVDQVEPVAADGEPLHDVLSLALAAYDVGADAVLAAKGVPNTNEAQSYVIGIRALLPKYLGLVPTVPTTSSSSTDTNGG
jgi:hypothetical protein